MLDNHIYVLGGTELSSTEIMDLTTNTWTSGPELPRDFKNGQAITYQDSLYAIFTQGTVYKLDDDKAGWTKVATGRYIGSRPVNPALVVDEDILHC